MKPKKQIDFLVEEFFNTGKIDINKDEEGITFDQLETLNEIDFGVDQLAALDYNIEDTIGEYTKDFYRSLRKAIDAEYEKKNREKAKSFYEEALVILNRLWEIVNDEEYKQYGKAEFTTLIQNAPDVPFKPDESFNFERLKNDIERLSGEEIPPEDIDPLPLLDPTEEPTTPPEEETSDEEVESTLSKEEQLENMQAEIDDISLDDTLDERAAEILSLYVPTEEHQISIEKINNEINKKKLYLGELKKLPRTKKRNKIIVDLKKKLHDLNIRKMEERPITQLFLNDSCLIDGFIYDWSGSPYHGTDNEYELYLNRQDIYIRRANSYFIQALLKSDNITDLQKEYLIIKLKNPDTQILLNHNVGFGDLCGLEDIQNERDPATIRNTMVRELKEKFIIEEDDEYKLKIESLIETSIKLVDSIFNEIVKNEVLQRDFAFIDRYKKLFKIVETYSEGETSEERYISLLHVVYDLNQLLETVSVLDKIEGEVDTDQAIEVESDEETTDPLSKRGILKLIKKIFNNITNAPLISYYFGKVRDSRNARYEKSFNKECNGVHYFQKEPGGDKPRLVTRTDNNNMVIEYITGDTRTQDIVTTLFDEINTNNIRKWDLKVLEPVVLNKISDPTTTITLTPEDLVEVKLTNSYADYHLSEFFGVYKTSKNKAQFGDYIDRYEEVIEGLTGQIARSPIGTQIIDANRNGIVGVFYQDYVFCPIDNLRLSWADTGQSVSREKRLSIRLQVINTDELYVWKQGNANCGEFKFLECEQNPGCPPTQNESTNHLDEYISEALGF